MKRGKTQTDGTSSGRRLAYLPRIFLTYCFLLFVVFLALFPMYRSVIDAEQRRNLSEHHIITQTGYGQMVSNLNNSILQLSMLGYNSTFEKLAHLSDHLSKQQYWYLREVQQPLSYLTYMNDTVLEAVIFFRDNNITLTTSRVYTPEQPFYNDKFFYLEGLGAEDFSILRKACLSYTKVTFLNSRRVFLSDRGIQDSLICYIPISIGGQSSGSCGAFLFLDAQKTAALMDPAHKGGLYALSDGQGNIFHTFNCTRDEARALISQTRDGKVSRNGITFDAVSIQASSPQITCYSFTDIRLYSGQTRQVMRYVILTVMAAMAVGIALSIWLTYIQYRPIKRLRQAITLNCSIPFARSYWKKDVC